MTLFMQLNGAHPHALAAEEARQSRPVLSMQIRQLEDTAGPTLFEKPGKKTHLMQAGSGFFRYS